MNGEMKRVFLLGFSQESNCFNPVLEQFEKFLITGYFDGNTPLERGKSIPSIDGMMDVFSEEGIEIVAGTRMKSVSGGRVNSEVFENFMADILQQISAAGRIDGVICALHGATMTDKSGDVCGDLLERIRSVVGNEMPIAAAFDMHANITEKVASNADYICGFREYPHIDQKMTGARAARLLADHLNGKRRKTVRVSIPMIAPASGYTTRYGALKELHDYARGLVENGEITDYTVFQVQPWLDTEKMASVVITVDEDAEKAKSVAADLAKRNFDIRHKLLGDKLMPVEQVINKAIENRSGKPVILVDSADSPNAGSVGDSAEVLRALLPFRDTLKCAVAVTDITAVKKACELGVGTVADFTLGADIAPKLTSPVLVKNAQVIGIYDGKFRFFGPASEGILCNIGRTVVLKAGKIFIHLSEGGRAEGDLNFYRSFGIEPCECDLVCVKACTSFRAGYEPIAAEIYVADTPGAARHNLTELPFEKRPVPLFPFEEMSEEDISEPVCYR